MPSPPPASANSQPKPTEPLPQRPGTNPPQTSGAPRAEEATVGRAFNSFGGPTRNPLADGPSLASIITGEYRNRQAGNNSASSLGGPGKGLRPSYSPFGSREPPPVAGESLYTSKRPKLTVDAPKYTIGSTRHEPKPATPASASPTIQHSHPGAPHHHHHHHHHHPHGTAAPTPATTPATAAASTTPATASTSLPKREAPFNYGYRSMFGGSGLSEQDLRERERARQREREREQARIDQERKDRAAKANPATSPRASTGTPANPYPRPSLPPSPTAARTLPSAASASPVIPNKASPALPSTASASGSSQRPNLPLPSLSAIGGRSLPSPFDAQGRERPPSATAPQAPGAVHRRTPSGGSGTRPDPAALGPGQLSPGKPATTQPGSRTAFGTSAFGGARDAKSTPNTSQPPLPSAREPPRSASTAAAAPKPATAATSSAARPPGRDFPGSNYPGYGGFMPFSGGFDYGSFGGWGSNSANHAAQRAHTTAEQDRFDRERKRLQDEQEARMARVRAVAAQREKEVREAREAKERQKEQERLAYARQAEMNSARIKEANQRMDQANRDQFRRYLDSNPAHPAAQTPHDALQQVAPRREPRPYEYKTDSRDYQYTPRDKRPRMDAAVDDARRGNANKSKRRKDEDRPKSPVRIRDFSHLTEATRKYPDVKSTAIEAWLKTKSEMNRVVATETYTGGNYRMSHHRSRNLQGGLVKVHIGGGFLGQNWKLRGAPGWEDASSCPVKIRGGVGKGLGEISARWEKRGIWGTDVYTDDSDLGLVLVHAGWIMWGGQGPSTDSDDDTLVVDVRIVPPLVHYTATDRCGVLTRNWGNGHDGSSIVIEAVKRVPVSPRSFFLYSANQQLDKSIWSGSGRKNRKRQMAEYARERDHVFDLDQSKLPTYPDETRVPLADEIRRVNNASLIPEPFLLASRDGPT